MDPFNSPANSCPIIIHMAHPAVQWALAAACGCYVVGCGWRICAAVYMARAEVAWWRKR